MDCESYVRALEGIIESQQKIVALLVADNERLQQKLRDLESQVSQVIIYDWEREG